jgi:hypothetical protein
MSDDPVTTPDLPTELPPVPAEAAEAWQAVADRCKSPRLRNAIRYCLGDYSYGEAAKLVGLAELSVRQGVERYGLKRHVIRSDKLVANHRAIGVLATQEILERLYDPEKRKKLDNKDLNFMAGTSTDKVAARERWVKGQPGSHSLAETVGAFAEKLIQSGGKLAAYITTPHGGKAALEITPASPTQPEPQPDEPGGSRAG